MSKSGASGDLKECPGIAHYIGFKGLGLRPCMQIPDVKILLLGTVLCNCSHIRAEPTVYPQSPFHVPCSFPFDSPFLPLTTLNPKPETLSQNLPSKPRATLGPKNWAVS